MQIFDRSTEQCPSGGGCTICWYVRTQKRIIQAPIHELEVWKKAKLLQGGRKLEHILIAMKSSLQMHAERGTANAIVTCNWERPKDTIKMLTNPFAALRIQIFSVLTLPSLPQPPHSNNNAPDVFAQVLQFSRETVHHNPATAAAAVPPHLRYQYDFYTAKQGEREWIK